MNRSIWIKVACAGLLALTACNDDGDSDSGSEPQQLAYSGYDYVSHYAELDDGLRMHYLDEGEGKPILLLHGVPTQAYLWRNIIPALKPHGRVIAPDLLNFGLSDKTEPLSPAQHAERVTSFIETLGLQDVTLVLQDWGGPIGFNYASKHPDNIRAIAFFETPPFAFEDISIVPPPFLANVLDPEVGYENIVQNNYFIECFVLSPDCGGSVRAWTDAEREVYRAPFPTPDSREQLFLLPQYLPFLDATGHPRFDPDGVGGEPAETVPGLDMFAANDAYLASTDVPKLFVYGLPGPSPLGLPLLERIESTYSNVQVATVGSAENPVRHFIQEDAPEELGDAIAAFLATL